MSIVVADYEPEMREPVSKLFSLEYGQSPEFLSGHFARFYEHDYQRSNAICVVAREEGRIVGFQSFFLWPYRLDGKEVRAFQSGNSLVHPDFRGRRIFRTLLESIYERASARRVDFLLGFPVEASFRSFLRNGWTHVLDLQWFAKPIWPLSFFHRMRSELGEPFEASGPVVDAVPEGRFRLTDDAAFRAWRNGIAVSQRYPFSFSNERDRVLFELKMSRRNRVLVEATVGDIRATSYRAEFLRAGLEALTRSLRRLRFVSFLSLAINRRAANDLASVLPAAGFKALQKHIHFIVRDVSSTLPISEPERWILYRSDIDTW